jgi:hypothetical protein
MKALLGAGASEGLTILKMRPATQIRGWHRLGLCIVLYFTMHGFAIAQTETSTPPKKPVKTTTGHTAKATSTTHTTNAKHPASAHATTSHGSYSTSAQRSKSSRGKKGSKLVAKKGQQAIDPDRAREIQTALIREHYMQGEPTGVWDSSTQEAMQRYQADQGWQSKTTPDSRALIKLGLGPSHDHLLNPENAMTMPTTSPSGAPKSEIPPNPAEKDIPQP